MAAKLKVDQIESVDGSANVTLNNSITMASGKTLPAASLTGTLPAISAANLTAIPAANITGTLPAISGANLTGITSGSNKLVGWQKYEGTTSNAQTTSSSWQELMVCSYTPASSNSTIVMTYHGNAASDQGHSDAQLGFSWNRDSSTQSTNVLSDNTYGHYLAMNINWTLFGDIGDTAFYTNSSTSAKTFRAWYKRKGGTSRSVFAHRGDGTDYKKWVIIQEFAN
jgi:hypothetical protein